MELPQQIKKYRQQLSFSQEELADRIYVSRQTISNWETGKSYPDIHSIILLSQLFEVTLDELIQGDVTVMQEVIQEEQIREFKRYSNLLNFLLAVLILSCAPLFLYAGKIGIVVWVAIWIGTMVIAFKVDKLKKVYHIRTYKEIVAFYKGKRLDEIEKAEETGKYFYQKTALVLGFALISFFVVLGMCYLLDGIKIF